jgi:hypothetical protein
MLRSPFALSALVLSLAGIVGQVILQRDSDDGIGLGLLWIIAGNAAIGIIVGMRVNPIPLTWKKATATSPEFPYEWYMWAPAGLALAAQAVGGAVLATLFSARGPDSVLTGILLGVFVAAGAILSGFLVAAIVIWPIAVVFLYLLALVRLRPLRAPNDALSSTTERPGAAGPLFSAMLLLFVGGSVFLVAAVAVSPSDSSVDRTLAQVWGVLFDYSTTGPVNQALAWAARGCAIALIVVVGLMLVSWSRRDSQLTIPRDPAEVERELQEAAEKAVENALARAAAKNRRSPKD